MRSHVRMLQGRRFGELISIYFIVCAETTGGNMYMECAHTARFALEDFHEAPCVSAEIKVKMQQGGGLIALQQVRR